jgi:hypothetical protein
MAEIVKLAKQDSKGNYRRDLGWEWRAGLYVQHRFYVGKDRADACIRVTRLERLWDAVEGCWNDDRKAGRTVTPRPQWCSFTISIGMAIAKGDESVIIDPAMHPDAAKLAESPILLAKWFGLFNASFGGCGVRLVLPENVETLRHAGEEGQKEMEKLVYGGPRNETLHAALDVFSEWIGKRYSIDDIITPTGKRYQRQVEQIKAHCADVPLALFGNEAIQSLFYSWQRRPISKKTGKSMAIDTVRDAVKRIRVFLRWLHSSSFSWKLPTDYIATRVTIKPTPAENAAKSQPHGRRTYSIDELEILWRYASPWERSLMLLGLNLGFGQAEIQTLQLDEISIDEDHGHYKRHGSWIKRIRFKTGVYGEWEAWDETVQAIEWLKRRRGDSKETTLVLTRKGKPLTGGTKGGSRNMTIANAWSILLRRIQKDYPQFRKLSFNKLRKTASSFVRRKYGAEIAGIFLAHGKVCSDDLLERYADRDFRPVFRACRHWRKRLEPMFAKVDDPFPLDMRKHNPSVTPGMIEKMKQLQAAGKTQTEIAEELGLCRDTVRRHLATIL